MKKIFYLLIVFSLFLVACGEKKSDTTTENKVVTVAQGAKPKSLDPHMYNSIPDLMVSRQFYNTLFNREKDGTIVPELAETYEYKNDKELDIVLKKGIKFHDGSELTADDVVFSFQVMKDKPGASIMIEEIDKVEKVNDYEVKILLKNSSSPLLFNLAHPLTSIVSKKYVEAGNDLNIAPMGTGAFKLVAYNDGEKIEMEAFQDYFEGAPKIQKLIIRSIPEDTSRLAALETGEIDIATGLAPINTQTIEANDKLDLISEPTTATEYICLNVEKAPFTNKEFRQALNYAIDKKSIVDSIFLGRGKVAKSIVNPNVFGYYDGLEEYPYNPEKAKELIEKSGVKERTFSLYVNDSPVRLQVAQIIQANLKDIGIDLKIETLEWGTYLQKTGEGDYQAFLGGWISGTSDADIVLYPLLDSKSIGLSGNRARYSNPDFDKEVEMARVVLTPEERKEHYKNAQIIAREDSPLIVLFNKNENIGINKRILGFEYDPTTMHKFKNLDVK
ncbi:ABC transporter substrate-binding protein [Fusobacterium canifelinum]|uniref:ABC transporter substrate-binding protein n=1 Tax=Fusobacterium canifelinum TaxID=285729 RepID=A0A3P1V279_9FUSO|nr:ABC transporter substrate-binding protein [Fusobacterium canifelinum]RRD28309.1 ABC transporter substrate-binding protein [Fusobacterium canifelinum]